MHLTDEADQFVALNNVYNHLKPVRKFIFDTFSPDLNYLIKGLEPLVDFEGEYKKGNKLKRIVSTRPGLINQLIHVHFMLEWD